MSLSECFVSDNGMFLQINLSHALFRRGKLHDEYDDIAPIVEAPWKTKRRNRCYKALIITGRFQTEEFQFSGLFEIIGKF